MSLDLNLLVVLEALLEEQHVTRAGERAGLSQPATSNALKRLRRIFQDPLLVRSGNNMLLTERAKEIRRQLRPALEALERALDVDEEFDPSVAQGTIRMATTDHVIFLVMPRLQAKLSSLAPRVTVRIRDLGEVDGPEMLRNDQLDLLIGEFQRLSDGLDRAELFHDDACCLLRADHPGIRDADTTAADPLPMDVLLGYPHVRIAPSWDDPGPLSRVLAERGLARPVCTEVFDYLSAPFMLLESDAIAVLSRRVAERFGARFGLMTRQVPVPLPVSRFDLVWHPRFHVSELHQWFRRLVLEVGVDEV